jgi:hypothetical protein
MKNIAILLFIPILAFGFGSETVKQIDTVKNNTAVDITLDPVSSVKVNSLTGGFALQSGSLKELEESAVTNTELGYVSGVTSSIQTQLDAKALITRLINTTSPLQGGGDLSADRTLSILQSGTAQDGYLSSVDWNTFNSKSDYVDPLTTNGDILYYNSGSSRLPIGSENQILQVISGLPSWQPAPSSSPLTTKGDLYTYDTDNQRLGVGTAGQILSVNLATTTGLEWIDPPSTSPTTTEGDLIVRGVSGDERLAPSSTSGWVLTSNGSGVKPSYQAQAVADFGDCQTKYLSSNITSNTNDVTDLRFTNLSIGQKYTVYTSVRAGFSVIDDIEVVSRDGVAGSAICYNFTSGSGGGEVPSNEKSCDYTATTTTLSHDIVSINATNTVFGGSNTAITHVRLCESKKGTGTSW